MQGGTVEHATVVATPRALTRGWSYTALSRARDRTRLHIDGQDVAAAVQAERAELAPHDARPRPQSAEVLARAVERMKVRDDEDLAVTQLPVGRAPGRADDPALHQSADPAPERAAIDAEPHGAPARSRTQLHALRAELEQLRAEHARLPLRELREVEHVEAEISHVDGQRDDIVRRLEALAEPQRTLLGRVKDPHAAERARLIAALGSADRHLAALQSQHGRLTAATGGLGEAREERAGLERRIAELERDAAAVRDELAERDVVQPPTWARELFGGRPADPRAAEQWDRGVRALAQYRVEHDVSASVAGVGPEPGAPHARNSWRQTNQTVRQVQRRLGRSVEPERDVGLER